MKIFESVLMEKIYNNKVGNQYRIQLSYATIFKNNNNTILEKENNKQHPSAVPVRAMQLKN